MTNLKLGGCIAHDHFSWEGCAARAAGAVTNPQTSLWNKHPIFGVQTQTRTFMAAATAMGSQATVTLPGLRLNSFSIVNTGGPLALCRVVLNGQSPGSKPCMRVMLCCYRTPLLQYF